MNELPVLRIPSGEARLPDTDTWHNRFTIHSSSSHSVYSVSQHRQERFWACSCPGWTRRKERNCKHLRALGLPGGEHPFEVQVLSETSEREAGIGRTVITPGREIHWPIHAQESQSEQFFAAPEPEPEPEMPKIRRFKFGQGV